MEFEPMDQISTNAYWHICKYVDWKDSAAMLTSTLLASVAPEVNLRNPLCTGEEACKWGIHPGFETQGRHHQRSKTGVPVAPRKGLMYPPKKCFKKVYFRKRNGWFVPFSVLRGSIYMLCLCGFLFSASLSRLSRFSRMGNHPLWYDPASVQQWHVEIFQFAQRV